MSLKYESIPVGVFEKRRFACFLYFNSDRVCPVKHLITKYDTGSAHWCANAAINNHLRKSLSNPSVDRGRYRHRLGCINVGILAYLNCLFKVCRQAKFIPTYILYQSIRDNYTYNILAPGSDIHT